jgi:hypothetical protein
MGAPPQQNVSSNSASNAVQAVAPSLSPEAQRAQHWVALGAGYDTLQKATDSNQSQPGSIWRTILSAALVGAAAGAGHGWKGMGEGAKAEAAVMDRQQKLKQQQVENERQTQKDDLENERQKKADELAQTKEQREGKVADSAILHNNAATALANVDTATKAKQLVGMSQLQHDANVSAAKPEWDMFRAAGGKPWVGTNSKGETITYDNIRETDALHKEHPDGFGTKRWLVTGTAPIRDKDGNAVDVENTYTLYDTQAELPLTASQIKQWGDDGLLKAVPNLLTSNIVKTDQTTGERTISWLNYRNLQKQAEPLRTARLQREEEDNKKRTENDQHDLSVARQNEAKADQRAHRDSATAMEYKTAKEKKMDAANIKYRTKGWDSLVGDEKYYASGAVQDDINHQTTLLTSKELQEEEKSMDPAVSAPAYKKAGEYRAKIEELSKKILPPGDGKPTADPKVSEAITRLKGKKPEEIAAALDNPLISDSQRAAIRQGLGIPEPAPQPVTKDRYGKVVPVLTTPPPAEQGWPYNDVGGKSMGSTPPSVPFDQLK